MDRPNLVHPFPPCLSAAPSPILALSLGYPWRAVHVSIYRHGHGLSHLFAFPLSGRTGFHTTTTPGHSPRPRCRHHPPHLLIIIVVIYSTRTVRRRTSLHSTHSAFVHTIKEPSIIPSSSCIHHLPVLPFPFCHRPPTTCTCCASSFRTKLRHKPPRPRCSGRALCRAGRQASGNDN